MSLQSDLSKIKTSLRTYENLTAHAKGGVEDIHAAIAAIQASGLAENLRPVIRLLTARAEFLDNAVHAAEKL